MDLDDYIKQNKGRFTRAILERQGRRKLSRRARDEEERIVLVKLMIARRKKWLENGWLEILGPHNMRVNLAKQLRESGEVPDFPLNKDDD